LKNGYCHRKIDRFLCDDGYIVSGSGHHETLAPEKGRGPHSGKDLMVATATYCLRILLDVEEEVHDVAVLNDILLAFDSELSCRSAGRFGLE